METKIATAKEAHMALAARAINSPFPITSPTRFHFKPIPKIGGIRINTRKKSTAPM
jgi:hypothetical protein